MLRLVTSIPPDWLAKDSSAAHCDDYKLWDILHSDVWRACPPMLAFKPEDKDFDWKEGPGNGLCWNLMIPKIFLNYVGIENAGSCTLGHLLRKYQMIEIATRRGVSKE